MIDTVHYARQNILLEIIWKVSARDSKFYLPAESYSRVYLELKRRIGDFLKRGDIMRDIGDPARRFFAR